MKPRYAIIEYENYGRFTPIIVATGSLFKLLNDLFLWNKQHPVYKTISYFSYVDAEAHVFWFWNVATVRKIVEIDKDMDDYKITEHMRIGRWL